MEMLDINNPTTLVGGLVIGVLTIAMWLKKWANNWKAEGLEAARIDSQLMIVESLNKQLESLTEETRELRAERRQLQESIDTITEQWREERKQWREERERLAATIDKLTREVEELKAQRCWDGNDRRKGTT